MARRAKPIRPLLFGAVAGAAACSISVGGFQLWQAAAAEHQAAAAQQRAAAAWASGSVSPAITGAEQATDDGAMGAAIARLIAPALGVDLYVMPDADWDSLADGPGLFAGVRPGESGESVIAGHRETHFAFLRELAVGDFITVEDRDGRDTTFEVTDARIVDGRTMRVGGTPPANAPASLLLVTCYPFDSTDLGPERYLVTALAVPAGAAQDQVR